MKKDIRFNIIAELLISNRKVKLVSENTESIDINTSVYNEFYTLSNKPIISYLENSLDEYVTKNKINKNTLTNINILSYNAYSKEENIEVYFEKDDFNTPTLKCFVKQSKLTIIPTFEHEMIDNNTVKYIITHDGCNHRILDENNNIICTLSSDQLTYTEKINSTVRRKIVSFNNEFTSDYSELVEINPIKDTVVNYDKYTCNRNNTYNRSVDTIENNNDYYYSGVGYDKDCLLTKDNTYIDANGFVVCDVVGINNYNHKFLDKILFDYRYKMTANQIIQCRNGEIKLKTRAYPIIKATVRLYKYVCKPIIVRWKITAVANHINGTSINDIRYKSTNIQVEGTWTITQDSLIYESGKYAITKSQNEKIANIGDLLLSRALQIEDIKKNLIGNITFTNIRLYDNYKTDTGDETWNEELSNDGTIWRDTTNSDMAQDGSYRITNNSNYKPKITDDLYSIGRTDAQIYEDEIIKEIEFNMYDYVNGYLVADERLYNRKLHNRFNEDMYYTGTNINYDLNILYTNYPYIKMKINNNKVYCYSMYTDRTFLKHFVFNFPEYSNELSIYRFNSSYTSPQGINTDIFLYAMCTKNNSDIYYKFTVKRNDGVEEIVKDYSSENIASYKVIEDGNYVFKCYISHDKVNVIDSKSVINTVYNYYSPTTSNYNIIYTSTNKSQCKFNRIYLISGEYYIHNFNDNHILNIKIYDSSNTLLFNRNIDKNTSWNYITYTANATCYAEITITSIDKTEINDKNISFKIINYNKENIKHEYFNYPSIVLTYNDLFDNTLMKDLRYKFITNIEYSDGNIIYNNGRTINTNDIISVTGDMYTLIGFESKNYNVNKTITEYFPPLENETLHGVVNGDLTNIYSTDGKKDFSVRCFKFKILNNYYNLNFSIDISKAYVVNINDEKTEINTNNVLYKFFSTGNTNTSIPEDLITFYSLYNSEIELTNTSKIITVKNKYNFDKYGDHIKDIEIDLSNVNVSTYKEILVNVSDTSNNVNCDLSDINILADKIQCKLNIHVFKTADEKWSPSIHNGYYYINSDEYFLYSDTLIDDNCIKETVYKENTVYISFNLKTATNIIKYVYNDVLVFDGVKHIIIDNLSEYMNSISKYLGIKVNSITSYTVTTDSNCEIYIENNKLLCKTKSVDIEEYLTNDYTINNNKIILNSIPQQYCPITILDNNNKPLYHIDNINSNSDTLKITESFISNGSDKIFLMYTDINNLKLKINNTETTYNKIINNCVYINQCNKDDIIDVEYYVNKSFSVTWNDNNIEITFNDNIDTAKIYYENNKLSAYKNLNYLSLNPIWNTRYSGFFYISNLEQRVCYLNINMTNDILFINTHDSTKFYIECLDEYSNPIENLNVSISCEKGTIILDNISTDINGVISGVYKAPNEICTDNIRCSIQGVNSSKQISIKERVI